MTRIFPILLFIVISCSGDKYDYIKDGQRFNKKTGMVEYKVDDKWVLEAEYKKNQSSNNNIIEEVKKILHNIPLASKMYSRSKNVVTFDIKLLEKAGQLEIDKKIKDMWKFSSDAKGKLFSATSTELFPGGNGIKIFYNPNNREYLVQND